MNALTRFSDIQFDPTEHAYSVDGTSLRSVTRVVSDYTPPFNAPEVAAKVALKRNTDIETILTEWEQKRVRAAAKGNRVHAYIQSVLRPEAGTAAQDDPFLALNAQSRLPEQDAFDHFLSVATVDLKLEFIEVEWIVGDRELQLGGTVDAVAFSEVTQKWHILDWKTNENFRTENRWERLKPPFGDLHNCELATASLQTSLYRLIIERNLKADWQPEQVMGQPYIVHLASDGRYHVHRPYDLRSKLFRALAPDMPF